MSTPPNGDYIKKAFDFVSDSTKQLITLATAILTLTVTFASSIFGTLTQAGKATAVIPKDARWWLGIAWVFYLVSIVAGLVALFAWVSALQPPSGSSTNAPSVWTGSARVMSGVQQITFFLATLAIVIFGIIGLTRM
jgi:hypothetical protein